MSAFILAAVVITMITVLLLLRPLLRQDQSMPYERDTQNIHYAKQRLLELEQQLENDAITMTDYDALKFELESTLLGDIDLDEKPALQQKKKAAHNGVLIALLCTLIPVGALVFYQITGNPGAIDPIRNEASSPTQQNVNELIASLENRLQQAPSDIQGWAALARTYLALGQYDKSIKANLSLLKLTGDDAGIYAQLADAEALKAGGNIAGQASVYLERALELDPKQPQALWLAGLSSAQQGLPEQAKIYWNQLMPLLADAPQQQQELREIIQQTIANTNQATTATTEDTATKGLAVSVKLADSVRAQTQLDETVFVFVKASNGPPAPLAVRQLSVGDLPAAIQLSDADAMMPQFRLSQFNDVVVSARIAKSGNPVAQPGDIQSALVSTKNDSDELIELTLSEILE